MRWGGLERDRRRVGRAFQIVERLGFERQRDIILRQRRRAQRFLKFGIERRAFGGRRGGGFCARHPSVGCRWLLKTGRGIGRRRRLRRGRRGGGPPPRA